MKQGQGALDGAAGSSCSDIPQVLVTTATEKLEEQSLESLRNCVFSLIFSSEGRTRILTSDTLDHRASSSAALCTFRGAGSDAAAGRRGLSVPLWAGQGVDSDRRMGGGGPRVSMQTHPRSEGLCGKWTPIFYTKHSITKESGENCQVSFY